MRDRHTLVVKRVSLDDVGLTEGRTDGRTRERALDRLQKQLSAVCADTSPFWVRLTGIATFEPAVGAEEIVVYLAVESSELVRLHRRLCRVVAPVGGIEGDEYVPHVTLARGDAPNRAVIDRLCEAEIEPVRWRVDSLDLYDAAFREVARRVEL